MGTEILFTVICSQFRYEPWKLTVVGDTRLRVTLSKMLMCDFSAII